MKTTHSLLVTCIAAVATAAQADVKSLTSSELTETYIKDSTIIVTPAKPQEERQKQVVTYTIGPGEPVKSEAEEQAEFLQERAIQRGRTDIAEESARQIINEIAFVERQTPAIAPLVERQINVPSIPDLQIPEGPFNMPIYGNELGISSDGQRFTFSFGNPPGITTPIDVQAIQSDLVNLEPRPGGGFDMTIAIPQR